MPWCSYVQHVMLGEGDVQHVHVRRVLLCKKLWSNAGR
jgi:hypothetical protein